MTKRSALKLIISKEEEEEFVQVLVQFWAAMRSQYTALRTPTNHCCSAANQNTAFIYTTVAHNWHCQHTGWGGRTRSANQNTAFINTAIAHNWHCRHTGLGGRTRSANQNIAFISATIAHNCTRGREGGLARPIRTSLLPAPLWHTSDITNTLGEEGEHWQSQRKQTRRRTARIGACV